MTTHDSQPEPTAPVSAADTAVSGKPARKAPRRATAAAGAPSPKAAPAPAMLVIDENGMIVPPPTKDSATLSGNDAGPSPLAAAPPADGTRPADSVSAESDPAHSGAGATEDGEAAADETDADTADGATDDSDDADADDGIEPTAESLDGESERETIEPEATGDDAGAVQDEPVEGDDAADAADPAESADSMESVDPVDDKAEDNNGDSPGPETAEDGDPAADEAEAGTAEDATEDGTEAESVDGEVAQPDGETGGPEATPADAGAVQAEPVEDDDAADAADPAESADSVESVDPVDDKAEDNNGDFPGPDTTDSGEPAADEAETDTAEDDTEPEATPEDAEAIQADSDEGGGSSAQEESADSLDAVVPVDDKARDSSSESTEPDTTDDSDDTVPAAKSVDDDADTAEGDTEPEAAPADTEAIQADSAEGGGSSEQAQATDSADSLDAADQVDANAENSTGTSTEPDTTEDGLSAADEARTDTGEDSKPGNVGAEAGPSGAEPADPAKPASDGSVAAAAVEAEPQAEPAPEAEPAPMSRRERRLAEQQAANGSEVADLESAATASPVPDDATAGTLETQPVLAASPSTRPRRKRNRFVAFVRGLFFLVVISALVLSTGTVLSSPDSSADEPSPTQQQRQAAWETTVTLEVGALSLADAARTPELRKALSDTAAHLGIQANALSDGLPGDTTATATATATAAERGAGAMTVAELLQGLKANSDTLLANAQTAEHAMGRVFASVGTGQILQASRLASVVGTAAPTSKFLPAAVDFPAPSGPQCTSTLDPRPGATIDSALRAAALAEQEAVYAYQVASTRFTEPQFAKSTALLARHEQKLRVLNEELELRCLPPAEPTAGFALDSSFTSMPKQALGTLEAELTTSYADLAALSAAASGAAAAKPSPAPTATAARHQSQDGTLLREVAVLWLLDSAQASISWGGTIDALPGIPE